MTITEHALDQIHEKITEMGLYIAECFAEKEVKSEIKNYSIWKGFYI
ncbi:hypothetical protein [Bacillus toyonensis]|nr:hypothetical protein [Bacillus toyonensis]